MASRNIKVGSVDDDAIRFSSPLGNGHHPTGRTSARFVHRRSGDVCHATPSPTLAWHFCRIPAGHSSQRSFQADALVASVRLRHALRVSRCAATRRRWRACAGVPDYDGVVRGRAVRHRQRARASHRLLQGCGCRLRCRPALAAAARPAVGRQILDGDLAEARSRGIQPYRRRCVVRSAGLAAARVAAESDSREHAAAVPLHLRRRHSGRAVACTLARGSTTSSSGDFMRFPVERIFLSEAARVGVGTYAPHDPTTADIADLVGSVDFRRSRRSATKATRARGHGPAPSMPRAAACSR